MNQPPRPDYDYDINRLVEYYKRALQEVLAKLNRLDVTDITRADSIAVLAQITEILKQLDKDSATWLNDVVPKAAHDGVAAAIYSLGIVKTYEEAKNIAKFTHMNQELVKAVIADTQSDLLQVTQNVDRKVRAAVRKVTADSMRARMASGVNGHRTISRDIITGLRKELGTSVETGIIDKAGRVWTPEFYVDTIVRTKSMEVHIEATRNEAINRNVMYAIVSRNGSNHEACAKWEGKVLKLDPSAPGDYPTIEEARSGRSLFHPRCKHVITPIRNPEDA